MARRREFTGIARAVLGSFMSRNNDVDGYWGIGQLSRHALARDVATVEIDLLKGTVAPVGSVFDLTTEAFRQMVLQQCATSAIPVEWLRTARIVVAFGARAGATDPAEMEQDAASFTCSVLLEDDKGAVREASASGVCWPTNPAREYRRICDDWNQRSSKLPSAGDVRIG